MSRELELPYLTFLLVTMPLLEQHIDMTVALNPWLDQQLH